MRIFLICTICALAGICQGQRTLSVDANGLVVAPLTLPAFKATNDVASTTSVNATNTAQDVLIGTKASTNTTDALAATNAAQDVLIGTKASTNTTSALAATNAAQNAAIGAKVGTNDAAYLAGITNGVGSGATVTVTGRTFYIHVVAATGTAASVDADLQEHKTNSAAHADLLVSLTNTLAPRSWVAGFSNAPATWNTDFQTVDVALPDGVTGQMFQENHVYGKNDTGAIISNGTVCYIANASGFNCALVPANATNGYLVNLRTIGIATHNIGIGASGKVTTFGNVNDINTEHLIEGQPVYLDAVTGRTTTNAATYPNATVHLGVCLRSHVNAGRVYVSVQSVPHPQDIGAATATHSQPLSTITNAGALAYSNGLTYADVGGASAAQGALAEDAATNTLDLAGTRAMTGNSVTLARDVKSRDATSVGQHGVAFGYDTSAGVFGVAMGYHNAAGEGGVAMGEDSTAGNYGAVIGSYSTAGSYGAAFGSSSTAGDYGFASGTGGKGALGSFVFADRSGELPYYFDRTTVTNGFSVRASGGTYFETPNLTVTGTVTAASFIGSGSQFTGITASQVAGALTNNQTSVRLNTYAINNGFEDQYAQTVSFDPLTRTAIVTPTGSTFRVTAGGVTYTSGAVTSSAGPAVSGNMFAYFRASDGAFICTNVAWTIAGGEAQAIYALYDHSNTSTVYAIDERHGVNISDGDHLMRHQTVGSTWASGITLSHFAQDTAAAAGANGTQTVIAVTDSGVFWDEDVKHTTVANGTTANSTNTCGTFPIVWKDATTWHRDAGTVFPFFWSGDTPQYVNAAGSKTSVGEDAFFVYWLIAVGSSNGTNLFLASHPETYSTIDLAKAGATVANLSSLLGGFPNSELMVCYRLIFNHNATAPNANPASVKSVKLRYVDDYRNTPGGVILAGTGPSAGSYELTADKIAAAGGLTNSGATINGQPITNGAAIVVEAGSGGGAVYTNWIDASAIGVGDESVFPTYNIRTNANGSMRFLGWDKTVASSYAGPFVISPLSTSLTNYWLGYHSTTGTTSFIFRWRDGLNPWTATTSALVDATGTLTNLDLHSFAVTGLTALRPIEVELSTVNTNSGTSAGYHYLKAWGWTP